ncbi:hypothetical protein BDV93DRAFT_261775 [Ceratobasidium sp. AG-I]|nr:hypothetical protein BDV93DRAFT_261775 [Ceratobasidium sp. AG-I]
MTASRSAPLAKRPHSPSTSNSPPAKCRAHSPGEGEVDDGKTVSSPCGRSQRSNPYANDGESPSQIHSTNPSQSHADASLPVTRNMSFRLGLQAITQILAHSHRAT